MRTKEEFYARWPELFSNVSCGFHCPDGWSDLLWTLCEHIEQEIEGDFEGVECIQVKEKSGGLRFYVGTAGSKEQSDAIYALIRDAEERSFTTCLTCGTTNDVSTGVTGGGRGWVSTQCGHCRDKPEHPRKAR